MKEKKRRKPMEKAIYVKAPQELVEMLNESQWHLKMRPAQIVREALLEYLEKHLPKEVKAEILKKGRK
jgi:GTPase Era involved in 16S rRNA processing